MPGVSHVVSTFVSYAIEKRFAKHPEQFGKGAIAGVAGPETANNATTGTAMIPLLGLGIPSIPATAILLSALIVLPARRWPVYLAAAFPAQMLVAWRADAPPLTMGLLFVTNCADAALGAFLVQRVSGRGSGFRFDGLRSTSIFAMAVTFATVLLSFADAGLSVATGWTSDYSAAFATRVRSNVLGWWCDVS